MSDQEEDLEILALQRQLDDAFATTRPRRGFEDQLWATMQASRPATHRLRDAMTGLWQGISAVPAVPAAAAATVLVVVLGFGFLAYTSGLHGSSNSGGAALSAPRASRNGDQLAFGGFGLLPSPVFAQTFGTAAAPSAGGPASYSGGPAQIVWGGQSNIGVTGAPVFRYLEPTRTTADQFASALGTVLRARPQGFLGSYASTDYTLKVRGTVQSPPSSPAYFIFASLAMEEIAAAGATPADIANIFLAEHSLVPQWSYTVRTDQSGDPVKVVYERQFQVPGLGLVHLVDSGGTTYGLEVDLSHNRPVLVSGMLPMSLEGAYYNLATPAEAIRPALAPPNVNTATPPPTIVMRQVELVYALVAAGDHSFFEPAYMFTGTVIVNGVTYVRRLLEPAVDPAQRKR